MKNFLYRYIFKKLFRTDFVVSMDEVAMLSAYNRMNTPEIIKLFRYLYTNLLASLAIIKGVNKEEEDLIKGRLWQISTMIDSIETAEESLLKIEEIKARREKRSKVLDNLKNKLFVSSRDSRFNR